MNTFVGNMQEKQYRHDHIRALVQDAYLLAHVRKTCVTQGEGLHPTAVHIASLLPDHYEANRLSPSLLRQTFTAFLAGKLTLANAGDGAGAWCGWRMTARQGGRRVGGREWCGLVVREE